MGDFNDYPTDESITKYLNASINPRNISEKQLLNTIYPYLIMNNVGTHKYQEHWGVLDQIIVSSAMITKNIGWKIKSTAVIFNADFLLIPDEMYLGQKTFRTYTGFRYQGGYSDHLPVFIDIICQ
jgi:predicted extracellular nuclease